VKGTPNSHQVVDYIASVTPWQSIHLLPHTTVSRLFASRLASPLMDPISIIAASATLIRLCATTGGYIFTFVSNARNIDIAITTLGVEINSLSQVLTSINDSFSDNALANAALSSQTGHEAQYWRNVQRSMDDCKGTLENLVRILENVRRGSGGFLARARSQINLGMNSAEITSLTQQIAAYRQTMQLSLQLITMYTSLTNTAYRIVPPSYLATKRYSQLNRQVLMP